MPAAWAALCYITVVLAVLAAFAFLAMHWVV